jgi:ERCC4-related helicase
VFDFLKKNTENGNLDIVTGFFSVNALALLYEEMNQTEKFRLILGKLTKTEEDLDKVVDLLSQDFSVDSALKLTVSAKKAIAFLRQEKVSVKTIERSFCHAKSYIYTDKDSRKNYFVVGSSNLTDAGLGLRDSSNIELNIAKHDHEDEYKNLCKWFLDKWTNVAADKILKPDKQKIDVKKYIIELIENLYRDYTPYDLYYKVLYERFRDDFLSYSNDAEFKKEIARLEDTLIYKTLYPYQQKGVLSLIQMLRQHNGAILADAVGLGKTWTALAVMKYFQSKGYTVILFAPKKLRNNWEQYQCGKNSKFESDEIDFFVRNHTDLQDERLNTAYSGKDALPIARIQRKPTLIVIDESHNLRNDKSSRYQFLIDNILCPDIRKRDVKVLQLSATPINNGLIDVRNQFKLIVKGQDDGFKETGFSVNSLLSAFQQAQREYTNWSHKPNRKIADFIGNLNSTVFKLADALIVARTRKLIAGEFGEMNFPKKEEPQNIFVTPENIGKLKSFDDIFEAIQIKMTAYRPSAYIRSEREASEKQTVKAIEDDVKREGFLVKMMYILLVKRLESSWFSFKRTVENILAHHEKALEKVNLHIKNKNAKLTITTVLSEEEQDDVQDSAAELNMVEEITLGTKNPVELSKITSIQTFKKDLENDVNKLNGLLENLKDFEKKFNDKTLFNTTPDLKLEKLIEIIDNKQKQRNKKVLIFTVYSDTAKFLYEQLAERGFKKLAYVSGSESRSSDENVSRKNFEPLLQRFAPYTKLYNEKDWSELYETAQLSDEYFVEGKWKVPYQKWLELIEKHDKDAFKKISNPIEILVATDCLSEGQNLQDCDLVVNYDIHWNPVRLIQRMGRIDRLGSPNKTISGVNFWPAKDYDDYLNLKSRVENRMAIMTVAGTEMPEDLTPELKKMVEDNPLFSKQTEKMLQQMQLTWDDIEEGDGAIGLNDLSLEQFRQELFELFKQKEEFFKNIPNGVYTGFRQFADLFQNVSLNENSLIAVLGYPRKPDDSDRNHIYNEIRLMHTSYRNGQPNVQFLKNDMEILAFLRYHKLVNRLVPEKVEKGDMPTLNDLSKAISDWLKAQALPTITNTLWDNTPISPEKKKIEEKFQKENFDLITWFVISK